MSTYNNQSTLYVRLSNNKYFFYLTENDRNNNTNPISDTIQFTIGIPVVFDFNHMSHTNNRLVMGVEGTTHAQINANFVPGITDYSKLIFDQGVFGQIVGVQPVFVPGYIGNVEVFSASIINSTITSNVSISINGSTNFITDNGDSTFNITGTSTERQQLFVYRDPNDNNYLKIIKPISGFSTFQGSTGGDPNTIANYVVNGSNQLTLDGTNDVIGELILPTDKHIFISGEKIEFIYSHATSQNIQTHPLLLSFDSNHSTAIATPNANDVFRTTDPNLFSEDFDAPTLSTFNVDIFVHCVNHINMGDFYNTTNTFSIQDNEFKPVVSKPVCFHEFTTILTKDGPKFIKDLTRGTMIKTLNGYKPLARLMKNQYIMFGQEFVKFPKNCFGNNVPQKDVLCTKQHPLMFDFKLVPASEFVGKLYGVSIVKSPSDQFNLLFEEQEYVNIEGITFVSHHPNHDNGLRLEEYFNQLKYRPGIFKEKMFKFEDLSIDIRH